MKDLKDFLRQTLVYGLGKGIGKFIGLFLMPFYTRALSPSDYGILEVLGVGIFFITAVFNLGLDSASGRFFYMAKTETEKGKVLFTVLVFRFATVIPTLIIAFFSKQISLALFGSDQYTWIVFVSIMIIPLQLLYSEQEHIYRYFFDAWKFNFVTVGKLFSTIGLGVFLVVILKMGILGAQINDLIGAIFFYLISFLVFNRNRYTYKFSWYWGKRMLKYGFPLIFAGMAVWALSVSDRYILLHFKSTDEVCLYSIGAKITQIIGLLAIAVQMSYGPLVTSKFESDTTADKIETKKFLSQSWRLFIIISMLISLFLSLFSYEIIRILAPPIYNSSILVIPFLLVSKILSQSVQMTSSGIGLYQKTKHFAWIIPVVAGISILLNMVLIPLLGFVGAGITTLIANIIQLVISYNISQRYFYVNRRACNVTIYLLLSGFMACIIPISEIYGIFHLSIWTKIFVFLVGISFPFVTGVIDKRSLNELKNDLQLLIRTDVGKK